MRWPTQPVINFPGTAFSAYGFTLKEIIVRGWAWNRWHVDIPPGLGGVGPFDFLMVLPQEETWDTCLGLLRSAIEQQCAVHITRETPVGRGASGGAQMTAVILHSAVSTDALFRLEGT